MSQPVQPGGSRGGPMLEDIAQQVLQQARGQRSHIPPGYEPIPLSAEEKAEAEKTAPDDARICRYCIGEHKFPTSIGCPRIAEATLDGDGSIRTVKFWPGKNWAKGRVVFFEDLHEDLEGDDDGS